MNFDKLMGELRELALSTVDVSVKMRLYNLSIETAKNGLQNKRAMNNFLKVLKRFRDTTFDLNVSFSLGLILSDIEKFGFTD